MGRRIALFGQAAFGRDVLLRLVDQGHRIVAVYAPPEGTRPDPLGEEARKRDIACVRRRHFRRGGKALPEVVEVYRAYRAELNVLAYVTVILPPEIVDGAPLGSLCFHPSLLPRYRGGAAIAWQILNGETETGVTIFRPDAGVDTGPIVVQRAGVSIEPTDSAGTLYYRKLYPLGVEALAEAVEAVDRGRARALPQDESRASFQGLVTDEVARIDWSRSAVELDRLVRGCDPQPGACANWDGRRVRLYDGRLETGDPGEPAGTVLTVGARGAEIAGLGGRLCIGRVRLDGGPKLAVAEAGIAPGTRLS